MKSKLFRRLLCVTMIVVIVFTIGVSASAAQWVYKNGSGGPSIVWSYYAIPSTHNTLTSNFSSAQNYWLNSSINKKPTFTYSSSYFDAMFTSGGLLHTVASYSAWEDLCGNAGLDATKVLAAATLVSTQGVVMYPDSTYQTIDYAYIEYNPIQSVLTNKTATSIKSIIAHEVGHCMGVEHTTSSGAIMKPIDPYGTAINSVDAAAYNIKY